MGGSERGPTMARLWHAAVVPGRTTGGTEAAAVAVARVRARRCLRAANKQRTTRTRRRHARKPACPTHAVAPHGAMHGAPLLTLIEENRATGVKPTHASARTCQRSRNFMPAALPALWRLPALSPAGALPLAPPLALTFHTAHPAPSHRHRPLFPGGARPAAPMLPSLPSLPLQPEEHAIHKYASKAYMQEDEGYDKWGPPPEGWEAVVQESLGQGRYRKYVQPGSVPGSPRWTGLQSLLTPPWIYVLLALLRVIFVGEADCVDCSKKKQLAGLASLASEAQQQAHVTTRAEQAADHAHHSLFDGAFGGQPVAAAAASLAAAAAPAAPAAPAVAQQPAAPAPAPAPVASAAASQPATVAQPGASAAAAPAEAAQPAQPAQGALQPASSEQATSPPSQS